MSSQTLVLLGDSIFDNANYVPGEKPVVKQLQETFDPEITLVELAAVDGAVTRDVHEHQLPNLTADPDLIVLSSGGNDALRHIETLYEDIKRTVPETLKIFHGIRETFRRDYATLLDALSGLERPTAVCTIYNPDFRRDATITHLQVLAEAALSFFNDVIVQEALNRSFDVLDLREICTKSEDFANPIEPSSRGGEKIVSRIYRWVASLDHSPSPNEVAGGC